MPALKLNVPKPGFPRLRSFRPDVFRLNFSERNPVRMGVAGMLGVLLLTLAALNSGTIIRHFTQTAYHADFADAGGLEPGDSVEVSGLTMGTVDAVTLEGDYVRVTFSVRHGAVLAGGTTASVSSATVLGTKNLTLTSGGTGDLPAGATIPLRRTTSPYDLSRVLSTLTVKAGQVNTAQAAKALETVAGTLRDAPPGLRSTLAGVEGLSKSIASRDGQLTRLLALANDVTTVLAERSDQVRALITDGNQLLATLYERRNDIRLLLANLTLVTDQLKGLVADNQAQLAPTLHQLRSVLTLLRSNNANLTTIINGLQRYGLALGEALGSGPWFYAYLSNIVPTNLAPLLPTMLGK